ncbi:protein kinase domain-containing protein [Actinomadura scrupuli]|uniref:protein kinase domain-containing protein n=1 Tax=Actinomadura scrupuli TaxID=559629 RepID=UPI003D97C220
MAEFEDPAGRTRRDPGTTHADRAAGPPGQTRRDAGGQVPPPRPGASLVRLPEVLARRFSVVGELPVQGAESDLLLVADGGGTTYVVKIFRRGYGADREVWQKLPALESPHVVRILETGHADDRDYEVIEYHPAGNLRALVPPDRPSLDPALVTEIVVQLAAGLDRLHRAGIVHRDLKLENVLVAAANPLRLVITDFGLSKAIEQSVVFASSSRTLAYAAPESLSGQVSPARDWWSLGMIVRELLTGRPPFLGMSETAVVDHLATRPIDNDDLADPRLRLLCQGLLTRDPRRRWGADEVTAWRGGASPPVAEDLPTAPAAPATGPGLPFHGRRFGDRGELARALVENWDTGARYFFSRGEAGEAWRALRDWLGALPGGHDVDDGRIELIDRYLSGPLPPDVKLLHLIRWLDPGLPPHYLGRRMTSADLPGLAALSTDPGHPDHRTACLLGRALWEHRLLPVLAGFDGGADLEEVDVRWQGRVAAWNQLSGWLRGHVPPATAGRLPDAPSPLDDPPVVLLSLLALAARPAESASALAQSAARARASVPQGPDGVAWFGWLADGAGDDPLRLLAVVRVVPDAVAEAEALGRGRRAAELQAADRARLWQEKERARLAGRGRATVRAVLWSLPLLLIWVGGSLLIGQLFGGRGDGTSSVGGVQRSSTVPVGFLLALSVLAWLVQCACEVTVARRQGGDYLPLGPWAWLSRLLGAGGRGLSSASKAVSGTARRRGTRGCGFLMIAGILPVLLLLVVFAAVAAIIWLLWILVLVAVPVAHAIGAGVRLHRWRSAHEQAEHQEAKEML